MSDLRESFGDDWDIGVWTLWRGRADLLIRAAGTGIALTGFFGFRARTVLWDSLAGRVQQLTL